MMKLFGLTYMIVFLHIIKDLRSQRRIRDGKELDSTKRYLIYFVRSEKSQAKYSGWTCGGALVTSSFVLTAAACIEDVQYLYAIGGYTKYVPYEELNKDKCTKELKKKVIYTCTPKAYEFEYENVGKWSAIDIGVAKVESPFLQHGRYMEICSHMPGRILINFDPKHQAPGIDAIVMGWGHLEKWREPGDSKIYLQKTPRYAGTQILMKKKCKEYYADFPELQTIIDKYMICTMEPGNLDDSGLLLFTLKPTAVECSEQEYPFCRRRFMNTSNPQSSVPNATSNTNGRRQGICQNDHGGPLVTWIGGHEYVIGVASVFRVNANSECEGPYLYTSTQCNGAFLHCILSSEYRRMASICNKPAEERGFDMIHRHISWANHSDGPADNENENLRPKFRPDDYESEDIQIRPQVPLRDYK